MIRAACRFRTQAVAIRRSAVIRKSLFHNTSVTADAQIFRMPAMSPTMTEGGVVSWKFQPGENFSSGDVLLEVETDKATIDVEAVDDGKMWEIIINNGATGVPVGQPIALIAEQEDDLSTLEKPSLEETPKASAPEPTPKKEEAPKEAEKKPAAEASSGPASGSSEVFNKANADQKLPPAVELLLHENNISTADALEKIPASGPKGRLLKGDVLAYLGSINKDSIVKLTQFLKSREHLDLSNIKIADPAELKKKAEAEAPKKEETAPEPVKPSNILTVELTSELGEEISQNKFKYAFEKSIEVAIRQTYGRKFPQYANTPIGSSLGASEDLFEELLAPSVTKSRFEVYGINYKFYGPSSGPSTVQSSIASDFDELLGLTPSSPAFVEQGSSKVNVEFKIKFDEKLGDSKQFVDLFEQSLLSQIPANKLKITN